MTTPLSSKIEAINVVLSDPGIGMAITEHRQEGYRVVHLRLEARGEFGAEATVHALTMDASAVELLPARDVARAIALDVIRQIDEHERGLVERMRSAKRRGQVRRVLRRA